MNLYSNIFGKIQKKKHIHKSKNNKKKYLRMKNKMTKYWILLQFNIKLLNYIITIKLVYNKWSENLGNAMMNIEKQDKKSL
jgi:hypothetical protein